MDPRPSSVGLRDAFVAGAAAAGASVLDMGVVATEMLYFGVAERGLDGGAMITASHNPARYNGMKLVGEGALPLSGEQGMPELMKRTLALDELPPVSPGVTRTSEDLYPSYVAHLHEFADVDSFPALKVVMDAANGVAGKLAPLVFEHTPLATVPMYFEVDGTFPNHEPNPLLEENSREIRERVLAERADLGIAWDGDADRCFFIDETGEFVPGDFVTALLAEALLVKHPGAAILYDLRASRAVPDTIRANGGVPLMNRVGHAFFKQRMRREPVLFGGEVSGHYYFRDNHNADSGFIPALLILDLLARKGATMAELLEPLRSRYFISGEINSTVDDVAAVLARLEARFSDGEIAKLDGVSVDYDRWHFNVRPSNTEPLVRLNLGADDQALMEEKRDLVLGVIRGA
jgi:phosphomannomutase